MKSICNHQEANTVQDLEKFTRGGGIYSFGGYAEYRPLAGFRAMQNENISKPL